jgi:hypothetical protein
MYSQQLKAACLSGNLFRESAGAYKPANELHTAMGDQGLASFTFEDLFAKLV